MPVVPTSMWADQQGQGAFTLYALDRAVESQNREARKQFAITMAPVTPAIVEPPNEPLPSSIIKQLPSIARPSAAGAQKVLGGGTCSRLQTLESETTSWLCRLGDWVNANPLLAIGLVAGTYVATRGK